MKIDAGSMGNLTTKLIACMLILVCLAVGAVGLIVPVIPGLLFLTIALIILARHVPSVDRRLRQNRTLRGYLDSADGFLDLSFPKKVRYGCLLCLRLVIDAVAFVILAASKLVGFAVVKGQTYR
jgi:uncharacterized membrane protein YbaN (DUF454 family)